jgi:hypothetical protein
MNTLPKLQIVIGPSTKEADELIRELRGGSGRRGRQFEDFVDLNNLIPVSFHSIPYTTSAFRQTTISWAPITRIIVFYYL